jgi:hypothetical protein
MVLVALFNTIFPMKDWISIKFEKLHITYVKYACENLYLHVYLEYISIIYSQLFYSEADIESHLEIFNDRNSSPSYLWVYTKDMNSPHEPFHDQPFWNIFPTLLSIPPLP